MSSNISTDRIAEMAYDIAILGIGDEVRTDEQVVTVGRTGSSWVADCVEYSYGQVDRGTGIRDQYEAREERHEANSLLKLIDILDAYCWTVS